MTDEEMAEQNAENISGLDISTTLMVAENKTDAYRLGSYDGFLAGLKAGRPSWHTPDGSLPDEEGDYLFYLRDGEDTMYEILSVGIDGDGYCYIEHHLWAITDVIAWCEIPEFK